MSGEANSGEGGAEEIFNEAGKLRSCGKSYWDKTVELRAYAKTLESELERLRGELGEAKKIFTAALRVCVRFAEIERNMDNVPNVGDGDLYERLEDLREVLETGKTIEEQIATRPTPEPRPSERREGEAP